MRSASVIRQCGRRTSRGSRPCAVRAPVYPLRRQRCVSYCCEIQLKDRSMDVRTYTKRTNARRAGVQAGIPAERLVITVHKGDEVRFGFLDSKAARECVQGFAPPTVPMPATPSAETERSSTARAQPEVRNGVRRPAPGGVCRAVWDWLDANPMVSPKDAKVAAADHGWNKNNVSAEYYAWRKFRQVIVEASNSI